MSQEFQNKSAVITDTSCFILLQKIEAFPILQSLFKNVVTTPEIAMEFGQLLPSFIQIIPVINKPLQTLYAKNIDAGEASAIALAMEMPMSLLILDDLKGRKLAAQLHLNYTGTLGMLILAKRQGIISSLKPYFEKIRQTDFRISDVLMRKILEDEGEQS